MGAALVAGEPESSAEVVPELAHLVVTAYFGDEAGREELAAARFG